MYVRRAGIEGLCFCVILLALFEIREERSDRWRHAPERPIEVELSDVASATHILEVGERGKRRFAVRTLVDRPKLVPSERILREDVDVVRRKNELPTAFRRARCRKVAKESFENPRMKTSLRSVRNDRQTLGFFGLKKKRQQIEQPHHPFGFVRKREPNGLAVAARMNRDQLFRDEIVALHAEDQVPAAQLAARRAKFDLDRGQVERRRKRREQRFRFEALDPDAEMPQALDESQAEGARGVGEGGV